MAHLWDIWLQVVSMFERICSAVFRVRGIQSITSCTVVGFSLHALQLKVYMFFSSLLFILHTLFPISALFCHHNSIFCSLLSLPLQWVYVFSSALCSLALSISLLPLACNVGI